MAQSNAERLFSAALSNEYQWRNLYLKEYGCCTYAPPMPKDPITTAEGIYPLRRQVGQLTHEHSDSGSDTSFDGDGDDERGTSLSFGTHHLRGKAEHNNKTPAAAAAAAARGRANGGDQFFLLDLSLAGSFTTQSSPAKRDGRGAAAAAGSGGGGGRRGNRPAALRKDDFFDANDAFSTKFFSFLWRTDTDDDDDDAGGGGGGEVAAGRGNSRGGPHYSVDDTAQSGSSPASRGGRPLMPQAYTLDGIVRDPQSPSRNLTLSRNTLFTSSSRVGLSDNPQGIHDALLRLHHETWIMLMDNRLLAWLHRQTLNHYQSATQLRQRLLDVVAGGPSAVRAITSTATATAAAAMVREEGQTPAASAPSHATSLTRSHEEALQGTFDSFSPFFVVIAPPPAVQRAKDQFQAARRAQLRAGNRNVKTTPADIVGLPLYSQYGSWREAYEHRHRWGKTPFSFFLLHDCSYNYAQVAAIFVELHLLYLHAHTHTAQCAEVRRESILLQEASRQLTAARALGRAMEYQRSACPLTVMQEVAENIILAYEQSPARTTLTMLRRVLDFLTDAALDVVTAHRFISRDALLRQSGFDLPGTEGKRQRGSSGGGGGGGAAAAYPGQTDTIAGDGRGDAGNGGDDRVDSAGRSRLTPRQDAEEVPPHSSPLSPIAIPAAFFEPPRVTEKEVNDLFELAYWFTDAATANANVAVDRDTFKPVFPAELLDTAAAPPASLNHSEGGGGGDSDEAVPLLPLASFLQQAEAAVVKDGRYLPGKNMLHQPAESFVQAVEMLEANRRPLWMQPQLNGGRGGRASTVVPRRAQSVAFAQEKEAVERGERDSIAAAPTAAAAAVSPSLSSDAFTGLATPLVLLTTYLRLHGGQWLKQLCSRVFDTLRKQSVMLYVNTLDIDAAWLCLRQPTNTAPGAAEPAAGRGGNGGAAPTVATPTAARKATAGTRRRGRGGADSAGATAAPSTNQPESAGDAAPEGELSRQRFIDAMGRFESVIAEDICYAVTQFFEALQGRRSPGRLPHGVSVLLTQFVTSVHLHLLESAGGANAGAGAAAGPSPPHGSNARAAPTRGPAGEWRSKRAQDAPPSMAGAETSPVHRVGELLRSCKQRYLANLRQRPAEAAAADAPHDNAPGASSPVAAAPPPATAAATRRRSRAAQKAMDRPAPPTAAASLSRLFQTIEHHRLAKFVLFDCWILPALNNAVELGYLAPDSPLHLRWNVDALARYLKVLVHAPFAEQDKTTYASVMAQCEVNAQRKSAEAAAASAAEHRSVGGSRPPRRKSSTNLDARHQQTPVLTLPPYLSGIYDVASGSLVRLSATSARNTAPPPSAPSSPQHSAREGVDGAGAASARNPSLSSHLVPVTSKSSLLTPFAPLMGQPAEADALVTGGHRRHNTHNGSASGDAASQMESDFASWERRRESLFQSVRSAAPLEGEQPPLPGAAQRSAAARSSHASGAAPSRKSDGSIAAGDRNLLPPVVATADGASGNGLRHRDAAPLELPPSLTTAAPSVAAPSSAPRSSVHSVAASKRRGMSVTANSRALSTASLGGPAGPQRDPARASVVVVVAPDTITPNSLHPYVFVNDAGWLDLSPAMQQLNERVGLTSYDTDVGGSDETPGGSPGFPFLPAGDDGMSRGMSLPVLTQPSSGAGAGGAAMTTGAYVASMEDSSYASSVTPREVVEDLPPMLALNAFCKAAATDESDNVVVPEYEVLPSMAAGCVERVYDVVTGAHPMIARALQSGVFGFTQPTALANAPAESADFSSLYTACLSGVLLHPRMAARVLQNVFENSPAFGQTLVRPVVDGTALELLSGLVAQHGDTPMVDATAIVPLMQMSMRDALGGGTTAAAATKAATAAAVARRPTQGSMVTASTAAVSQSPATSTTGVALVSGSAAHSALVQRWESESRRLLRHFNFLTTGYGDGSRALPLVPGISRPVGPAHPIHLLRAGAQRIAADHGGHVVPVVFDPWWRAMVVALTVKASNMFDECREERSVAFVKGVQESAEVAKQQGKQAEAHFVSSKGKESAENLAPAVSTKAASNAARNRSRSGAPAAARRSRDGRKSKGSGSGNASTTSKKKATSKRSVKASAAASVTAA